MVKSAFEEVFMPGESLEQHTGRGALSVEQSRQTPPQLDGPSAPCPSRPRRFGTEQDRVLRTEQRVDERRAARTTLRAALLAWRAGLAAAWAHASHRRAQLRVAAYRMRLVSLRGVFVRMRVCAGRSLDALADAQHLAGMRGRRGLACAFTAMGEHAVASRDGQQVQRREAAGRGGEQRGDADVQRTERPRARDASPMEMDRHGERGHLGALCCDAGEGERSVSANISAARRTADMHAASSPHGGSSMHGGEASRAADRSYTDGASIEEGDGRRTADRSYRARVAQLESVAERNLATAALRSDEADALRADMAALQREGDVREAAGAERVGRAELVAEDARGEVRRLGREGGEREVGRRALEREVRALKRRLEKLEPLEVLT